jgi:hypothetical protein
VDIILQKITVKLAKHSRRARTSVVCFLATMGACVASKIIAAEDSQTSAEAMVLERAQHLWSFQPVRAVAPPSPKNNTWAKNPIDAFVLSKLRQGKLAPASSANRLTLLRRAYFDLVGLPPSQEQIEKFARDRRPEAYLELIERLLASPQYGERWGRHWLDVARYADTGGFEQDFLYQNAWQYRDYVIRAFNTDKPFNQFIQEQVAGDELWPDNPEATVATALYAIGPVMQESAMISTQLEYDWLTDAADTTGAAFLGLTMGCARCHNHKYDPISQKDYFAMQAIFAASERPYPEKVRETRLKVLNGFLAEKPLPNEFENDPRCTLKTEKQYGLRLLHSETPLEVRLLRRGELSKPREVVEPGVLTALAADKAKPQLENVPPARRRAALAKWLVSVDQNPLTPRVIVNRVWAWHFGEGLVRTPNDFGNQGETPTHPELLDWLARDFVEHGWSLKYLHRLIMLSSTYQQSSVAANATATAQDPENRLLSHFPRRRLDADAIWDSMHASAGTLNLKQFGPPVVPPLTPEELTALFQSEEKWKVTKDPSEQNRRGVYLFVRRTFLFPMFDAFDPPEVMTSCARRMETVVPAQALALLNSRVSAEQSRALAVRLLKECGDKPDKVLARAWLLAFNRPITKEEKNRSLAFLKQRESDLRAKGAPEVAASSDFRSALTELCLALFNANEFTYID